MLFLQAQQGQDAGAVHVGNPRQIDPDGRRIRFGQEGLHLGKQAIRIVQRNPPGEREKPRSLSFSLA